MLLCFFQYLIMRCWLPFVVMRFDVIFAHRMVLKIVPHQDAPQIGMAVEHDAVKVVDFALLKFAAAPNWR